MYTVYKITNKLNHKYYVGVRSGELWNYWGSGVGIKRAIKKYGIENFRREALFCVQTKELAYSLERLIVDEAFVASKATYNITLGGKVPPAGAHKGFKHSAETKRKMREAKLGKQFPNMSAGKMGNTLRRGTKTSVQGLINMSLVHKGKPWTMARRLAQIKRQSNNLVEPVSGF